MVAATVLLQSQPDSADIARAMAILIPFIAIGIVVGLAVVMVPFWFILKKAGFSPWLTLINAVPIGNLVLLYVVAFSEWKTVAVQPPYPPYPPTYPPSYPPQV